MKESYTDDIMLCFVQGFGNNGESNGYKNKTDEYIDNSLTTNNVRLTKKKRATKNLFMEVETVEDDTESNDVKSMSTRESITRKSLRITSGDKFLKKLPEVKRSFSDRFSVVTDVNNKRPKGLLTIRKTWSTGNFATGAAGGGCGAPRSAPATPLQLEPLQNSRPMKHDKQAVKPLSSSVPSVRQAVATGAGAVSDASEGKAPSKARQKKFFRHFPQVGPEERVLNYYSCALVGDILLQGHLYITKNYFAFYSNVFGYVTKLLIPTPSVLRVTKEKMARIIPNAVGVCTRDERHVFGSLLSRDSTYKLMMHVWKQARTVELRAEPPPQVQRVSETELDASEFSVEDETSSAGGEETPQPTKRREPDAIISGPGAAVIQPALLTGATRVHNEPRMSLARMFLVTAAILLMLSAACLAHQLYREKPAQNDISKLSGSELYSELMRWRSKLHGRAATELQAFLSTNLMLLTKVRQSLETLSGVILTDMAQATGANTVHTEVPPNDTAFS